MMDQCARGGCSFFILFFSSPLISFEVGKLNRPQGSIEEKEEREGEG